MLASFLIFMALSAGPSTEISLQTAIMQEQIRQLSKNAEETAVELRELRSNFLTAVEKLSARVESEFKEFRLMVYTIDISIKGGAIALLLVSLVIGATRLRFRGKVVQDGE